MDRMIIRQEQTEDYPAVYRLVKTAFEGAEHRDGTEQDLVERLRKSAAFVPELSLVAERDGEIVGHILFTKAHLGTARVLGLAPLSVSPACQKQGIGMKLMLEGHRIARALGYEVSIVLGNEQYYPRVGYLPAAQFGIRAPFEVPDANFMALSLQGVPMQFDDVMQYAPEFSEA